MASEAEQPIPLRPPSRRVDDRSLIIPQPEVPLNSDRTIAGGLTANAAGIVVVSEPLPDDHRQGAAYI